LPRDRRSGFTLLEMIVVLAVLSMVVGIAFPLLAKRAPAATLGAAAREVRAALAAARSAAVAQNREVTFAGATNGYRIDGAFHPVASARDIVVGVRGGAWIAFFPSGGSSGGRVGLRSAAAARDIEINPITGRATLVP
jgi:prepilin-type N-terminal cleavage/methylation domain-containing protein